MLCWISVIVTKKKKTKVTLTKLIEAVFLKEVLLFLYPSARMTSFEQTTFSTAFFRQIQCSNPRKKANQ